MGGSAGFGAGVVLTLNGVSCASGGTGAEFTFVAGSGAAAGGVGSTSVFGSAGFGVGVGYRLDKFCVLIKLFC